VKRPWLPACTALLLLTAGCGDDPPQSEAAERAVKLVEPGEVDTATLQAAVTDRRMRQF